jgi:hypothetical protein
MAPIFAQQSVRENNRIGRTPQQVLDAATLGVFQEGWKEGYGADADHLKTTADIEEYMRVGYTFVTIDPSEYVDEIASTLNPSEVQERFVALPWSELESTAEDTLRRYTATAFELYSYQLQPSSEQVHRAAVKYGKAIAHTVRLVRHIASGWPPEAYEIEMSVDEAEVPTTAVEHLFIASELKRLGVHLVSLAPRFNGRFEKGVDFIGDFDVFASAFERHLEIARRFGPYKLSLHSGSDKFTLYPVMARLAKDGLLHVKTAGTSYLEALRTIAAVAPELFREILLLSHERFEIDRATYHISAERKKAPDPLGVSNNDLAILLDEFNTRQILHVTFGSVLQTRKLQVSILDTLSRHEDVYHEMLVRHFKKHIIPFKRQINE